MTWQATGAYTYISVWRDGVPLVAFEVTEDKSKYWVLPHRITPTLNPPSHSEPREVSWRGMCRALIGYQSEANVELSESFRAWARGWEVPTVSP